MTYGLNDRLFVENGPAVQAAKANRMNSHDAYRVWSGLNGERRIALVDKALRRPANDDLSDGLPIAL